MEEDRIVICRGKPDNWEGKFLGFGVASESEISNEVSGVACVYSVFLVEDEDGDVHSVSLHDGRFKK